MTIPPAFGLEKWAGPVFVDTGAFLARYLQRDGRHEEAVRGWQTLRKEGYEVVTSNFVVDETLTLLGRRASYSFAAERARRIYDSEGLTLLRPEEVDERTALDWFAKFADQKVSFTDCVSFALMRRYRVRKVFTFDLHFALAGFDPWPYDYAMLAEPEPAAR